MQFLSHVLGLWVAGEAAQAANLVATAVVTPDVVNELGQAAAFAEDPGLSARLKDLSGQLQAAIQTQDTSTTNHLRTSLAQLFKEMDEDARRRLAQRLRGLAGDDSVSQTLLEMMGKGRWRELGTFLLQQSESALQEPAVMRARFALNMEQGDWKAAQKITEKMMEADPLHPEVYLCRAELALTQENLEEAQKMANEAQRVAARHFPGNAAIYDRLCSVWVRIHLAKKNWARAEDQLQEWFDRGSDASLAERYYLRGKIRENSSKLDPHSMTIWMGKAVELSPLRADYLLALARAYFGEKKNHAAREVLQKMERILPINPNLWQEAALLRMEMGEVRSALENCKQAADLLKPRVESLIPAGLGIVLAYAHEDWEAGAALEMFMLEIGLHYDPKIQDRPLILRWAIQNFDRAVEERKRSGKAKFPEVVFRFGAALFAASAFLDPFLDKEDPLFIDLAWKLGAKIFTDKQMDPVMDFLLTLKGLPSQAASYVHDGVRPESWNESEEATVLAAIQLAFKEARYWEGLQLVRDVLIRFGLDEKMKGSSRAHLERWRSRLIFYWAFEGTAIAAKELEDCFTIYRQWTNARERLNYIRILIRRYDAMQFLQAGDRLLTLSEDPEWMYLLAHRFLEHQAAGGDFDSKIVSLPVFRAALVHIQGSRGSRGRRLN